MTGRVRRTEPLSEQVGLPWRSRDLGDGVTVVVGVLSTLDPGLPRGGETLLGYGWLRGLHTPLPRLVTTDRRTSDRRDGSPLWEVPASRVYDPSGTGVDGRSTVFIGL